MPQVNGFKEFVFTNPVGAPQKRRKTETGDVKPSGVSAPVAPPRYHDNPAASSSAAAAVPTGMDAGEEHIAPGCRAALAKAELFTLAEQRNLRFDKTLDPVKLEARMEGDTCVISWQRENAPAVQGATIHRVPHGRNLYAALKKAQECYRELSKWMAASATVKVKVEAKFSKEMQSALQNGEMIPDWNAEEQVFRLFKFEREGGRERAKEASLPVPSQGPEGRLWHTEVTGYQLAGRYKNEEHALLQAYSLNGKKLLELTNGGVPLDEQEGKWVGREFQISKERSGEILLRASGLEGKMLEQHFLFTVHSYINRHPNPYAKVKIQDTTWDSIRQYREEHGHNPTPWKLLERVSSNMSESVEYQTKNELTYFYTALNKEMAKVGASSWLDLVDNLEKYSKQVRLYLAELGDRANRSLLLLNKLRVVLFGILPSEKKVLAARQREGSFFYGNTEERQLSYAGIFDTYIAEAQLVPGPVYEGAGAARNFVKMMKRTCGGFGGSGSHFLPFMLDLRMEVHPVAGLDDKLQAVAENSLKRNSSANPTYSLVRYRLAKALGTIALDLRKSSEEMIVLMKNWDTPENVEGTALITKELESWGYRTTAINVITNLNAIRNELRYADTEGAGAVLDNA